VSWCPQRSAQEAAPLPASETLMLKSKALVGMIDTNINIDKLKN
jgi:hypothetical protein